ncbi:MAG: hypothetical protein AAF532_05640 [Planctomycetota bacterium]
MSEPSALNSPDTTPDDVAAALFTAGIDVSGWGRPTSKTLEDLAGEIAAGESVLELDPPPPKRIVRVVRMLVVRDGHMLVENSVDDGHGHLRNRHRPPSEKLLRDENPVAAALRGLMEELAVDESRVTVDAVEGPRVEERPHTGSYPGLHTAYVMFDAKCRVEGLALGPFETTEHVDRDGLPGRTETHRWGWVSAE